MTPFINTSPQIPIYRANAPIIFIYYTTPDQKKQGGIPCISPLFSKTNPANK